MINFFNEIKYAYQRVRYGYDERIKWGFSDYFETAIKPLEEFCVEQLSDEEFVRLNPNKAEIFTETLNKIQAYRNADDADYWKHPNTFSILMEYVGKNINYYWD